MFNLLCFIFLCKGVILSALIHYRVPGIEGIMCFEKYLCYIIYESH